MPPIALDLSNSVLPEVEGGCFLRREPERYRPDGLWAAPVDESLMSSVAFGLSSMGERERDRSLVLLSSSFDVIRPELRLPTRYLLSSV